MSSPTTGKSGRGRASRISLRARYQISLSHRWATIVREDRYWRAFGSLEGFATLAGEQGQSQEQVRAMLGMERSVGPNLSFHCEIVWQKRGLLFFADESVNDIFLRARIFHRM